jgi:hypothetical protein
MLLLLVVIVHLEGPALLEEKRGRFDGRGWNQVHGWCFVRREKHTWYRMHCTVQYPTCVVKNRDSADTP